MAYFTTRFLDLAIPQKLSNYGSVLMDMSTYLNAYKNNLSTTPQALATLKTSLGSLNATQVANVLCTKELNEAQFDQLLTATTLTAEEKEYVRTKYKVITADQADAASKTTTTFSWEAFTVAIKKNIAALWTWLTTNPVGWCVLAAAAIAAVAGAYDLLTTSVDEHIEKIKELDEEFDSNQNQLDTLNSELQTTIERIEELQELERQGVITLTEKGELEQLQLTNSELTREIALLEQRNAVLAEKREEETSDTWRKFNKSQNHLVSTGSSLEWGVTSWSQTFEGTTEDFVSQLIEWLKTAETELQQLRDDGFSDDSGEIKTVKFRIEAIKDRLTEIQDTAYAIGNDAADALVDKILAVKNPGYAYEQLANKIPESITTTYLDALETAGAKVEELLKKYNSLVDESEKLDLNGLFDKFASSEGLAHIDQVIGESGVAEALYNEFRQAFFSEGVWGSDEFDSWLDSAKDFEIIDEKDYAPVYQLLQMCRETEEALDSETEAAVKLADALEAVATAQGLVDDIKSDIEDSQEDAGVGNISLDTLQSIIEEYSDLGSIVQQYIDGQVSADAVLDAVEAKFNAASDAANYYESNLIGVVRATENLKEHLSSLATAEDAIGDLSDALGEFRDDGIVTVSTLSSLQETFGANAEEFAEFVRVAGDSNSTMEQVQAAADNLAKAYLNSSDCLKNLEEGTKDTTIAQLELLGVTNAAEVVETRLAAMGVQENFMAQAAQNATEATWDNIEAFAEQVGATEDVIEALKTLQREEAEARLVSLDFNTATLDSVKSLMAKTRALGITAEATTLTHSIETLSEFIAEAEAQGFGNQDAILNLKQQREDMRTELAAMSNLWKDFNLEFDGGVTVPEPDDKKETDDPWKDEFEAKYNEMKHLLEMERITAEDFYDWLDGANEKYFANNTKYLDEYRKYSEEVFGGLRDLATDFSDSEHQIFLWEKAGGHTSDIVTEYRNLQERLHNEAQRYRREQLPLLMAQGYDKKTAENIIEKSEYIQQLQELWWGYEDDINSALDAADDRLQEHLTAGEHDIFLMEQNDISKSAIIAKYKSMQDAVHETAEEIRGIMRESGMSEYEIEHSDVITGLQEQWWEYHDTIEDVKQDIIDDIEEMISAASDAVDSIQDVYDALHSIADEYAENEGFISVDSFQKIAELGPQYMQYLRDENGMLEITEEKIKDVIAAKTRQLAVDTAMAYVEKLRVALNEGSIEDLNELLYATNETTDATWGLVYANLALLDLTDDQRKAALDNINALRSLSETAVAGIGKATGTLSDSLNNMKDGLDDILQYVMDMIKSNIEQEIQGIEDAKDAYADLIEKKKESLRAAEDEKDYQDDVADKIKEIAKLQERIDALALDDSREAQAERARLLEEQAELQADLDDIQSDHAIETQEDSLDKMQEAYEDEKDKEIKILEDSIGSQQKLYDKAIAYIDEHWDTLYSELIAWNYEYGNNLETEITAAWDNCTKAVERYGSAAAAAAGLPNDIEAAGTSGSNTTVGQTGNYNTNASVRDQVKVLIKRMKERSASWQYVKNDPDELKKLLYDQDQDAAKVAALIGRRVVKDPSKGIWYIDEIGGEQLYTNWEKYVYHTGGIAGDGGTLKENELLAKLESGEAVISNQGKGVLFSLIDFVSKLTHKLDFMGLNNINHPLSNALDSVNQVAPTGGHNVHFGDVYIYGGNEQTVEKHRAINREFANEIVKQLGIKK